MNAKAPLFDHCEFFFDTTFKTCKFENKSGSSEGAYRQLKNKISKIENEVEDTRFPSYEIIARMKNLEVADWFEWVLSGIYFLINRCSSSILQPLLLILATAPTFYFFYFKSIDSLLYAIPPDAPDGSWHYAFGNWNYEHKAIAYSVVNSLGPIRLFLPSGVFVPRTPATLVGSNLQIILSSIFWFFLIFGIRKRFRVN